MKEIFDRLKKESEKYCLLIGWVDLYDNEDGTFYMEENIKEHEYIQKIGCFPHDMIRDAIGDHEYKVDKEGQYEIWCLMSFEKALVVDPDYDSYLTIEYIEYEFQVSFEERDKEVPDEPTDKQIERMNEQ